MQARKALTRREFVCAAATSSLAASILACTPSTPAKPPEPTQVATTTAPTGAPPEAPTADPQLGGLELPIVKEPLTLTYFSRLNDNAALTMKSYNEIACYQVAEKRTGIHLEFQHPPVGAAPTKEQFMLMIASGKYTDIIEYNWLREFEGGPAKAIRDGIVLRLNDIIAQFAPNLSRILAEHPNWRKQVVTDEGDMYVFPSLYGSPYILTFCGPVIRGDWLEKVGLPVPTTIDEWHTMLKAFKEKDPNGNGQADEIPFSPTLTSDPREGFDLTSTFVGAWGIMTEFYQDGGVVKYGALQPEFKEFLKTMAAWYKEGLIDPEYVSTDSKMMDAKVTGNQMGSFIHYMGSGIGRYMGVKKDDPNFKLIGAPYPVLVAGDKPQLGQRDFDYPGTGAAITTANKHVEETAKRLDYPYSLEGHMLFNFGVEGVSYKMVNGYPTYTDEIMKNPKGLTIAQAMARYCRANFAAAMVQDQRYLEQYAALPAQKEALEVWTQPSNEKLMPPVTPTQEESKRFTTIMNDVNTLYDEMLHRVIAGAQPVDSWDGVVEQFKQMGIEEAIAIRQAALERYNRR